MGYEVDFLAVGEGDKCGDAIAARWGNLSGQRNEQTVVVIDGGFVESGNTLVDHIKKFYNTDRVDLVISTHPDTDHISGLQVVLERLKVDCLWMHLPWKHTTDIANLFVDGRVTDNSIRVDIRESLEAAVKLEQTARAKGIPIVEPFVGTNNESSQVLILGPSKEYYEGLLPYFQGTPEPKEAGIAEKALWGLQEVIRKIAESFEYETIDDTGETTAENNSSTIILIFVGTEWLLFTGDAGIPALTEAVNRLEGVGFDFSKITFIQVPHHGSQRNIGPTILNRLVGPKLKQDQMLKTAFISVAKEGEPKHPAKKVTNAFRRRGAPPFITRGNTIWQHIDAPLRTGWVTIYPLPFYNEVEE